MRLPQDVANLLAVAIRDVIWFKQNVSAFLDACGVPKSIMLEVRRMQRDTPTIKIVHHVFDQLAEKGDEGFNVAKRLLTKLYYWNDFHTIPTDRKEQAMVSLKALREAYKRYEAQEDYQKEQERKMHAERAERSRLTKLDHVKLQSFRDEFDCIHALKNRQERGNQFQDLMNKIF
ncbi:MAG: hypothetical protein HYY65_06465, partial [Candidatus Tectomicrobia bacterium]|nr:hypothetical protein [Candidatus Tectomicrobia bacterium]